MKTKLLLICLLTTTMIISCTSKVHIENPKKGNLLAVLELVETQEKRIALDASTAPQLQYSQIFIDSLGLRYLTFINSYDNSIYFYNYETLEFIRKIKYERQGSNAIRKLDGYYIKNLDSIYIYNLSAIEIVLSNQKSEVLQKISLKGDETNPEWFMYYPQYFPKTVSPFLKAGEKLLLTGFFPRALPQSTLENLRFSTQIDLKSSDVRFNHLYPEELYGHGSNWDGALFTVVYPELHHDQNKLIYSFPVSHDLYITNIVSNQYEKVYGGSNFAKTISSVNGKANKAPREEVLNHYIQNDFYAAILYDHFRDVYYRFLLKGIPNAPKQAKWKEKSIAVIIMDNDFKYLGETTIGNMYDWHWENSFVTEEGLNIEYIEKNLDEDYLVLKIFVPETL